MNKTKKKKIKIKAWAIVERDGNYLPAEASPRWGRLWIFQTRKQARKEVKKRFYSSRGAFRIVKIKIIEE